MPAARPLDEPDDRAPADRERAPAGMAAQEIPGGVEGERQVAGLEVHDQDGDGVGGLEPDLGEGRGARGQGAFQDADELPVRAARDAQELVLVRDHQGGDGGGQFAEASDRARRVAAGLHDDVAAPALRDADRRGDADGVAVQGEDLRGRAAAAVEGRRREGVAQGGIAQERGARGRRRPWRR